MRNAYTADMKIRTKILLFVIAPILLANLVVVAFNAYNSFTEFKSISEAKFVADTNLVAERISKENTQGLTLARSAGYATSTWFGDRTLSTNYIKSLLEAYPVYVGASVGYEPNADFNDAKAERGLKNMRDAVDVAEGGGIDAYSLRTNATSVSIDEWLGKTEGGRFLAYWNRNNSQTLAVEPLANVDASMYSLGLKKKIEVGDKDSFIITEPYLYDNKTLMLEYSAPIMSYGTFSGQVAFDRDLASIDTLVASLKTFPTSEIFLISGQMRVICSTQDATIKTAHVDDLLTDQNGNFITNILRVRNGQLVRDQAAVEKSDLTKLGTAYRDLLKSAVELSKSSFAVDDIPQKVSYFTDPKTRNVYCVSQAIVKPGGWVLVQIAPHSAILAPVYSMLLKEFIGLGITMLVMFVALIFASRMLKRVVNASRVAEEIAKGNLNLDLQTLSDSSDETRVLANSMTKMVSNLRSLIQKILTSFSGLNNSSHSLEIASGKYEDGVKKLSNSIEEIYSTAREMAESSSDLTKAVEQVNISAEKGSESATEGRLLLSSMEKTMQNLAASTALVGRRLALINERASNINSVVTTISRVADETNMLSLNASIEAEKAGDYGSGFAVVAREIGRLADRTAVATGDIDSIVKDMQSAVATGVSEMEKFSDDVRNGVAEVERIIAGVDLAIERMQTIPAQLENLSKGVSANVAGANQFTDAINVLGEGISQSIEVLEEIASLRKKMRDAIYGMRLEVSKFKIDNKK